ncbi:MAG: hypothetical protein M9894_33625 [Planctomycetes bacterium]|nr:hypothetical protein [Planctomycetota bacterium]
MELLIKLVAHALVLVAAFKVWRWARRQARAGHTAWRRRVGLLFLLAPLALTVARALGLPAGLLAPLEAVAWINRGLDQALVALVGLTQEHLDGLWAAALRPLCYAVVYGGAGVLVGWPLDRLQASRAAARPQPEGDDPPDGASPA